jgi:hypothetical protein
MKAIRDLALLFLADLWFIMVFMIIRTKSFHRCVTVSFFGILSRVFRIIIADDFLWHIVNDIIAMTFFGILSTI